MRLDFTAILTELSRHWPASAPARAPTDPLLEELAAGLPPLPEQNTASLDLEAHWHRPAPVSGPDRRPALVPEDSYLLPGPWGRHSVELEVSRRHAAAWEGGRPALAPRNIFARRSGVQKNA